MVCTCQENSNKRKLKNKVQKKVNKVKMTEEKVEETKTTGTQRGE